MIENQQGVDIYKKDKQRTNWQRYFIFLVIYEIGAQLYLFRTLDQIDYLGILVELIFLIGLFGFAFSKPIFSMSLWKVIFMISVLWYFEGMVIAPITIFQSFDDVGIMVMLSFFIPFIPLLPIPFALYKYSQKSDFTWNRA